MNVTKAKDYVKHILSEWETWRTHHKRLEEATTTLLEYIGELEETNKALKKCLMRSVDDIIQMDEEIENLKDALKSNEALLISYMYKVGDLL